ncbi:precorrin-4 C(11)-methyltransferase [Nocardioides phosphati]|uniref:Precorrin-4 C(11)-methyltransferase n=1 Tax=Nocardioides phosphati TaxID=1867775 RepID=A0ABQ2NAS5_9ACTN|nr:precorrin-4 C(11)-methyltransferase [Nocardioides phosphati]GGO89213.1 precorrin-4 C(11)-methyltransferase [Nocardioides phosphati]
MTVHFVGAGPGAPDLITVRGLRLLQSAQVVMYAGALVPEELLAEVPADARKIDTQHLDLAEIVGVFTEAHAAGQDVVRLHSGDLSLYSAVAEQVRRLEDLGIDYDLCPGVPAYAAASAALGVELTVPEVNQSVVLTRLSRQASKMPPRETLANLGSAGALIVLHLATHLVDDVVAELRPNYADDCPAAVVFQASQPDQLILRGTLGDIAQQVKDAGLKRSAVILVGRSLAAAGFRDSHLYSCDRVREA